jgi:hypothetical protein
MKNQKGYNQKKRQRTEMSFDIHSTLASISLPIPILDVPSSTFHSHSHFPQYSTFPFFFSSFLLLILCMLSILLVLNHHFCAVPNNLSLSFPHPSIHLLFTIFFHYCLLLCVDPIDLILHPQKASSPFQSSFTIVDILLQLSSLRVVGVKRWWDRGKMYKSLHLKQHPFNVLFSFISTVRFFPLILCSFSFVRSFMLNK